MSNFLISTEEFLAVQVSERTIPEILVILTDNDENSLLYTITNREKYPKKVTKFSGSFEITEEIVNDFGLTISFTYNDKGFVARESEFIVKYEASNSKEIIYKVFKILEEVIAFYENYFGKIDEKGLVGEAFNSKLDLIEYNNLYKRLSYCEETQEISFAADYHSMLERAVTGISWNDWINFDYWFAKTMLKVATLKRSEGHTYPQITNGDPSDYYLWNKKLDIIIKAFTYYLDEDMPNKDYNLQKQLVDEALDIIKEHFSSFSD